MRDGFRDPRLISDQLLNLSERCKSLAARIGDEGEELSDDDKRTVRMAMYHIMEEATSVISMGFIMGNKSMMNLHIETIKDLMHML